MATRLGLALPQMRQYDIGRDVPDVARTAETIGYDSLWVFERALFPEPATQGLYGIEGLPWPDTYRGVADPLVTLALAAAVTERALLGTSVLVAPLHLPSSSPSPSPRSTRRAAAASSRAWARAGRTTSTRRRRRAPSRTAAGSSTR